MNHMTSFVHPAASFGPVPRPLASVAHFHMGCSVYVPNLWTVFSVTVGDEKAPLAVRQKPTTAGASGRGCGLAGRRAAGYTIHMKRTNLVLDEQLLEEATRLSGDKTYSATVQRALKELVRRAKARQILELRGLGLWEGDVGEMRRDAPQSARKPRRG